MMASDDSEAAKDLDYGGQDAVLKQPNLCMLALTPQQIHDRLAGRWSNQLVPTALMASVNLSLAFGSEYAGLTSSEELGDVFRHVFLSVSIVAFFLRMMLVQSLVQLIADLGRVPDSRMHDWLRQTNPTKVEIALFIPAELCTLVQICIALYAVSWVALGGAHPLVSTDNHSIRSLSDRKKCARRRVVVGLVARVGSEALMWTLHNNHCLLEDHYVLKEVWKASQGAESDSYD